jgi:hypothetical protein
MKPYSPESARRSGQSDRRSVRFGLCAILAAVAAVYVWYCAPIGAVTSNAVLAALLAVAAAVCGTASVRLAARPPSERVPRRAVVPTADGAAI